MKRCHLILALALSGFLLMSGFSSGPRPAELRADEGTRVGEIGWQYDTFGENLAVDVTPEAITTMDSMTVTVTSKIPAVWIKQANLYGIVYPEDSPQFPFTQPLFRVNDTVFRCIISPFPLNGYDMEFYLYVYDYYYEAMDSRTFQTFSYSVAGSGWKNETFSENLELTYWPVRVNASEEVTVTIASRDNVTIAGANLYLTYVTPEGELREGGWNMTKTNVNSTAMAKTIPGFEAGTNVTFWVTAWDQYNSVVTSQMLNYSVMGIEEYTDFPFEYTEGTDDRSLWSPDSKTLISMAAMCALAFPLFIYLYALGLKRRRKASDMLVAKKASEADKEVTDD